MRSKKLCTALIIISICLHSVFIQVLGYNSIPYFKRDPNSHELTVAD